MQIGIDNKLLQLTNSVFSGNNFEKINDEIYIWRGFLTKEECDEIVNYVKNNVKFNDTSLDQESRSVINCEILLNYRQRLVDSLNYSFAFNIDEFCVSEDWDYIKARFPGMNDDCHVDIQNWLKNSLDLTTLEHNKEYEKFKLPFISFVIYFNEDFGGGEIYYPEYDFKFKPKSGDVIFHSCEVVHGIHEVLSGNRFSHQGNISSYRYVKPENIKIFNKAYSNHSVSNYSKDNPDFYFKINQTPVYNKRLLSVLNQ